MRPAPKTDTVTDFAETTLPSACVVCGGDLALKVTGKVARSVCKTCHWMGQPEVTVTFGGLKVAYKPTGQA